ncbi:MAG: class I SAM-dependent methyltransferase, partial [Deltaproteobacteria bacterium]
MPVVRSNPPPALGDEPVLETSVSEPSPARLSNPPDDGEGSVVVRQVRRKIRAVGTGSAPPPQKPAAYADAPLAALPEALPSVVVSDLEDDFAVPPVDANEATRTGGEALRAPAVPTFDAFPGSEAEVLDSSDIALDEPTDSDDEESLDEPTEEITIPSELLETENPQPPVALKGLAPEAPRKPPAPPKAPPKAPEPRPKQHEATPPAQPTRRKRRPWWEEMFSDDYFRAMPKYTPAQIKGEVDFIEQSLGVEKGAVVLDVACGDGRQAIELATRGYEMIALDLSLAMLSRAADAAQDREAKLNFLHSDMCEMEFNE